MLDQLIIGEKKSVDDFDTSLKEKITATLFLKKIREVDYEYGKQAY